MKIDRADTANVIALPPLLAAMTLALGLLLHFVWPMMLVPGGAPLWLGVALIAVSIAIVASAVRELGRARTPLDVRKSTTKIVETGAFAVSRNPVYLSMILGFLGIAALLDSAWIALLAPALATLLQKGVIEPEERYLEQKFGNDYLRYKARVRRWV